MQSSKDMPNKYNLIECVKGGNPYEECTVEAVIDNNAVKVIFVAVNKEQMGKHTTYNAPLYEGDIVEILLTLGDKNRYLEVEVNPLGALYVAIVTNIDGQGDITVDFLKTHDISYNVDIKGDIWTTEIILPIQWLESLGYQTDAYWNLLREDYDNQGNMHLSCISPTYAPSFHKTNAFIKVPKGE